jgi:hypothetical protein
MSGFSKVFGIFGRSSERKHNRPGMRRFHLEPLEERTLLSVGVTINPYTLIGQADPTNNATIHYKVEFDKAIIPSSFTLDDIALSGSAAASKLAITNKDSGANKVFDLTVEATSQGTVIASLDADKVDSADGSEKNTLATGDKEVNYTDEGTLGPTVTVSLAPGQTSPTPANEIKFDVKFSADTNTGFFLSYVNLSGTAAGAKVHSSEALPNFTYRITVNGMTSDGTVIFKVLSGAYTDTEGKPSGESNTVTVTRDTASPTTTVGLASGQAENTKNAVINFSVNFSEAIVDFDNDHKADIDLSGSDNSSAVSVTNITKNSSTSYTVTVTATADGTVRIKIPAGKYHDQAGNTNAASEIKSVNYDTAAPTAAVALAAGQDDYTAQLPIKFKVTFNEKVTNFNMANASGIDLTAGTAPGAAVTAITAGSAANEYIVSVGNITAKGTVVLKIKSGVYTDLAGNTNAQSTSVTANYDLNLLIVTAERLTGQFSPTNKDTIQFRVTFSGAVTDFDIAHKAGIDLSASTAEDAAVTDIVRVPGTNAYDVTVEDMSSDGLVTLKILSGKYHIGDSTNASSNAVSVRYDTTGPVPTVDLADGQSDVTYATEVKFLVEFDEPVVYFNMDHLDGIKLNETTTDPVANPVVKSIKQIVGTNSFIVTVGYTPAVETVQYVELSISDGVYFDEAGNANAASAGSAEVTYDTITPDVEVDLAPGQDASTGVLPIQFSVIFDEPVDDFNMSNLSGIDLSGATAPGATVTAIEQDGGSDAYIVTVGNIAASGIVKLKILAGKYHTENGNPNTASNTVSVTYTDVTAPSVTVGPADGQETPAYNAPIKFLVTFSEPVKDFDMAHKAGIDTSGGNAPGAAVTAIDKVAGTNSYIVTVNNMTSNGNVALKILAGKYLDASGNPNTASNVSIVNYSDEDGPTVTVGLAAGQPETATATPVKFLVTFSEPVFNFNINNLSGIKLSDSTAAGAKVTAIEPVANSNAYTVTVGGMTANGTVTMQILADVYEDQAGNTNEGSASKSIAFSDFPTVTITLSPGQEANSLVKPVYFNVTFSEEVTDFTMANLSGIDLSSSTAAGAKVTNIQRIAGTNTYTVTVGNLTASGTVEMKILAGKYHDAVGNANVSSGETATTINFEGDPAATVGMYDPTAGLFELSYSNEPAAQGEDKVADTSFTYGAAKMIPIAGDWDGDGEVSIGFYNPTNSSFELRNTNEAGATDIFFGYGVANAGWLPIAGDWNGDGIDTVGLYNPKTMRFYLRNTNSGGYADVTFTYGPINMGWQPLAGDWNGDGVDTIGLYSPRNSAFYLKNTNTSGYADVTFGYGPGNKGWKPVMNDWDGDGIDTAGLYDPVASKFYLSNSNDGGYADLSFVILTNINSALPIAGYWQLPTTPPDIDSLLAAGGAVVADADAPALSDAALQPMVSEAIARWANTGLSDASISTLQNVRVAVADLPGAQIGLADGNTIYIDRDAAGHGWFVDPTPSLDEEFAAVLGRNSLNAVDSRAVDQIDLLSVVEHEMGHVLGLGDLDALADSLMGGTLGAGIRRGPA